MDERVIIARLQTIARDELTFLQKGYGTDMPDYVKTETQELLASISWLTERDRMLEARQKARA
jgi:triphosphoribosyl-dephospho-CoA synthetase